GKPVGATSTARPRQRGDIARHTRRLLVLERPRLVPPTLHLEVGRCLHLELPGALVDPCPELVEIEYQDVAQTLDPGLDEQLVLCGPEARKIQHQGLVTPLADVRGVGTDL